MLLLTHVTATEVNRQADGGFVESIIMASSGCEIEAILEKVIVLTRYVYTNSGRHKIF